MPNQYTKFPTPTAVRFWAKVEFTDTCWLWKTFRWHGYGQFWEGKNIPAHRYAYEFCVGPVPEGLQLDHLCRVRYCVNPDHLEAVTSRVNLLRGEGTSAKHARQTHCIHGHEFNEENTYICSNGARQCKPCGRAFRRARYWRNKQAAQAS